MTHRAKLLASIALTTILMLQLLPLRAAGVELSVRELQRNVLSNSASASSDGHPQSGSSEPEQGLIEMRKPEDFASISSAEEWNEWAECVNSGQLKTAGYTFGLSDDLDFTKTPLLPVGTEEHPFSGRFEGNGNCLIGINGILSGERAAPFACTSDAHISKLGVQTAGAGLCGEIHAAGLVGLALGKTEIAYCYFSGTVSGGIVGGLVAETREKLQIRDCYAVVCCGGKKYNTETSGVLLGVYGGVSAEVKAENFYGISPDSSIKNLFAPSNIQQDRIKTSAVYLLSMNSSGLPGQLDPTYLKGFDFDTVWKQPAAGVLPQLKWQKFIARAELKYTYSYAERPPLNAKETEDAIVINTGRQKLLLTAAGRSPGSLYSNLAMSENMDGYILETPMTGHRYFANFMFVERSQISVSQLSFRRIDENRLYGKISGLEEGEYYTISLEAEEDKKTFAETFKFKGQAQEDYSISGIPEGSYQLCVQSKGHYPLDEPKLYVDSTKNKWPDVELYKSIEEVKLTGNDNERVELYSRNRVRLSVIPADAEISRKETEVLINGEAAREQDYQLTWLRDSLYFIPNVSGLFEVNVNLYDMRGEKHTGSVTLNSCREIQSILLPNTVDITSMGTPVEIIPRILPADATDTQLDWTVTSGTDILSLSLEGDVCRLYPKKVGVSTLAVRSVNGLERTIRVRVLDKTPPTFGDTAFENITAVNRVMIAFAVQDDSGIAQVTAASKSGTPVCVSKLGSESSSYAFEGERATEYVITATDINGNSETMTTMPAELLQSGTGSNASFTNSGLAVSKSTDCVSLWVSANESEGMKYHWQKRDGKGEWQPVSNNSSKLEDSGLLPNTWYEYRVELTDDTGGVFTRTTAVHTNPTPLSPEDIRIDTAGSYGSVYVGETFPVTAMVSNRVDVTGQSSYWEYDEDAMAPETPGSVIFKAKRAGVYPLEFVQTDTFGNTASTIKMVHILSFDTGDQISDQRVMQLLCSMAVCAFALALLAILRAVKEARRLDNR